MKKYIEKILENISFDEDRLGFDESNIIELSYARIIKLKGVMNELKYFFDSYEFKDKDDEVCFFKEYKPEILSRLLYFNKVFQIESKFPNGSDDIVIKYLNNELDSLTYFFNRNLDFYQYYRSKSTIYDEHYFLRGKTDLRLNSDSSYFNSDPNFSTGYDFKVAKILAYEMLRIYLNKRLQNIGKDRDLEETRTKYAKSPMKFTGKKIALVELGYALANSGDINNGRVEIKEMMDFLGAIFNVDLGDYYRTYIAIKDRKKDRTVYLNKLIDMLEKKIDEDDLY